jgi:hypothetical protein
MIMGIVLEWRVSLHQPGLGLNHPVQQEDLFAEFSRRTTLLSKFYEEGNVVDVGTPLRRFDYPSGKRRTATSTQKMRDAENHLDQFWKTVDDHFKRMTGKTVHQLLSS